MGDGEETKGDVMMTVGEVTINTEAGGLGRVEAVRGDVVTACIALSGSSYKLRLSLLRRLYLCGVWVMDGGGVLEFGIVIAGRNFVHCEFFQVKLIRAYKLFASSCLHSGQ